MAEPCQSCDNKKAMRNEGTTNGEYNLLQRHGVLKYDGVVKKSIFYRKVLLICESGVKTVAERLLLCIKQAVV